MLRALYRCIDRLKYTPLHPQWIANRYHLRKLALLNKHAAAGLYVDIGAGKDHIAPRLDKAEVLTIDFPTTAIAYGTAPDVYADVQCLPLPDNCVDGVIFFEVLEHVRSDTMAISEIVRILKKDGLLFISAPFVYPLHDAPHDYKRFSHFGLPMLLQHNSMKVMDTQFHGNSLTTALQLMNLTVLESVNEVSERQQWIALLMILPAYFLCLLGNLLALPFLTLQKPNALVLGQTLVAKKIADGDG